MFACELIHWFFQAGASFSKPWVFPAVWVYRRLSAKIENSCCELLSHMNTSVSITVSKDRALPCPSGLNHILVQMCTYIDPHRHRLADFFTLKISWPQPALTSKKWNPKIKVEMMSLVNSCYRHHFLAIIYFRISSISSLSHKNLVIVVWLA